MWVWVRASPRRLRVSHPPCWGLIFEAGLPCCRLASCLGPGRNGLDTVMLDFPIDFLGALGRLRPSGFSFATSARCVLGVGLWEGFWRGRARWWGLWAGRQAARVLPVLCAGGCFQTVFSRGRKPSGLGLPWVFGVPVSDWCCGTHAIEVLFYQESTCYH